ncbi:hypothetical protein M569_07747 [Genlisea aurea]|uniref:Uncharacterized protein n=1 Tax=Genlisea aurea TaxID=192259 RepID=S8CK14_9LAMI|nr:hypothetical protein M569_07747 [Genlisea aurea]
MPTRDHSGHDSSFFKPRAASFRTAVSFIFILSISLAFYSTRTAFLCRPDPNPPLPSSSSSSSPAVFLRSPTNVSHIAFGIGGSASTTPGRGGYAGLWWKPNVTRGYVFLDKEPDRLDAEIPHRLSSDWTRFRTGGASDSALRIARVVADLFSAGLTDVRWFVMGDDDTIFFPENLATVLSRYDHRKMIYVGGNSESVEQNALHAYGMAFGGGGIAISYPLAERLSRRIDGCLNRYHYFYGSDQMIWACVQELGISLTRESGFHQMDIRGDPFGFLAAHPMAPLVSLHHLDHVNPLFPNRTRLDSLSILMKAYGADPLRTLQHCSCSAARRRGRKWSISVAWGYAVQIYPFPMAPHELATPMQTFLTWRTWKDGPFTFNTRPPLAADPCRRPVVFYLKAAAAIDRNNGSSSTRYGKSAEEEERGGKECGRSEVAAEVEEVVVVTAAAMDGAEFGLGSDRRRQCCEAVDGGGGIMRIRIATCV